MVSGSSTRTRDTRLGGHKGQKQGLEHQKGAEVIRQPSRRGIGSACGLVATIPGKGCYVQRCTDPLSRDDP